MTTLITLLIAIILITLISIGYMLVEGYKPNQIICNHEFNTNMVSRACPKCNLKQINIGGVWKVLE